LGGALLTVGRLDEAEGELTQALSHESANMNAVYLLGAVLEQQGEFPDAIATYRRALQLDPEHAYTRQSLGRLLLNTGATDEGRKHLLEAARLDPDNASPYVDLGNSFLREQNTDQASAMYRRALERYAAAGRLPEALSVARRALDVAHQAGRPDLAAAIRAALRRCEQQMALQKGR
jgi:tetratricopeptide (TPR) repeat protein